MKRINCIICGKLITIRSKSVMCAPCSRKGKKLSSATKKKISIANSGISNGRWKGSDVGLDALHLWIRKRKPKSIFCEKCGKITDKLDCSSINHIYERDISKWRWLCRRCHMKEDGRLNSRDHRCR